MLCRFYKNTFPYSVHLMVLMLLSCFASIAQDSTIVSKTDTVPPADTAKKNSSKFDKFNQKAEKLFKIIPVPLASYSTEAGTTLGLAKFNLFNLSKKDTISKPSRISGVVSYSTKGRINASIANDLSFDENRWLIISYINYKRTPEYIYGIGNDVTRDNEEEVSVDRIKFVTNPMRLIAKNLYFGAALDLADYFKIEVDSTGYLVKNNVPGTEGGTCIGAGLSMAYDSRDNRYNPYKGHFILTDILFYEPWMGSKYQFIKFELDGRTYFNPWLRHIIAAQATTTYTSGTVPFFELAKMGGDKKMRGYYEGAIRDKVLVDAQVEYRMPVWNIFGIAGWIGTGRVADYYGHLKPSGFWLSYGGGLRIRVDTKNNTNLRVDCGFGPHGVRGFYVDFGEAF
ncbi:BamA/TamA family outer membrane protein [Pinibacter soli]|uniref:BamA/TamA family outer membrane protein n=1 Tax=Pinibacter soli TaxID=3044211 RepID=A0ABT6RDV1_9BACT|nr:BamA/TamA family outer membrane protein [Pinibacter soli]MDI3320741.1 BamA/TamA family outer membrane protein [Pinibacter soli]